MEQLGEVNITVVVTLALVSTVGFTGQAKLT